MGNSFLNRRRKQKRAGRPEASPEPPIRTPEQEMKRNRMLHRLRKGRKSLTIGEAELRRICDLPIAKPMTSQEIEDFNRQVILAGPYESGFRLFEPQARALDAFFRIGGLFAPIGVGHGKTLITIKAADWAYHQGARKILLLMPPQVLHQLVKSDIPWARTKVSLGVPFHQLGKKPLKKRKQIADRDRPGCYLMPYSLLSTKDTDYLLETIKPEVVICDEAHKVKDLRAARAKRLVRYINEFNPQLLVLSGSITNRSIADYHHLIHIALGENCPLPRSRNQAREWGAVVDADVDFVGWEQLRQIRPLIGWARMAFPGEKFDETVPGYRSAYKHRLNTAPGVVATGDETISASLLIENRPVPAPEKAEGFQVLEDLCEQVSNDFLTPNGDEIDHAIHTFKWLYELSAGFYNELKWPEPEVLARKRRIPEEQAREFLELAQVHHNAKQEYSRELRSFLSNDPPSGIDTPMLVGLEISRNGGKVVGQHLAGLWKQMKDLEFEEMPEREGRAVRVCDYKIKQAVSWAKSLPQGVGGIIWCHHKEVARWTLEALREAGVKSLDCPAGDAGGERIRNPENAEFVCVASMPAHGTGKNLQHFHYALFLQWPRPAKEAEQVLGREHRKGQKADTVTVTTMNTLRWDNVLFAATLNDAIYITQTMGQRQKLIYADYNPLPQIYSSEFLRERGMENRRLDRQGQEMLREQFGVDS